MVSTPYEMQRVGYFLTGVDLFTVTACGMQAWEPLAQHILKTQSCKCTLKVLYSQKLRYTILQFKFVTGFFFNLSMYSVSLTEWRSICRFQSKFLYICTIFVLSQVPIESDNSYQISLKMIRGSMLSASAKQRRNTVRWKAASLWCKKHLCAPAILGARVQDFEWFEYGIPDTIISATRETWNDCLSL